MINIEMFQSTCFNDFFDLKDNKFNGLLIHSFILRNVSKANSRDELWFRVNDVNAGLAYSSLPL